MKPVTFEGHNIVLGAGQPQYQPLPAYRVGDTAGTVISCWELEPNDKLILERTGRIWLSQLTFNQPLQPQLPSSTRPAELGVITGPVAAEVQEPCCTDDPRECEGCRKPDDEAGEARKFQTKDGGLVAMASAGIIQMGVNPFGFVCADCGTFHSIGYDLREDGLLDIEVHRDEEETRRYREHLGIPGSGQDCARELIAVDDMVMQALAAVLPETETLEGSPEKRVGQLITILGMHREVLANYQATMRHMVKGIEIARDAVRQEMEAQRLTSVLSQSQLLVLADDALSTMVPSEKKEDGPRIILPGGCA